MHALFVIRSLENQFLWFIVRLSLSHSKNVRVKISGSFENDTVWVKCASFNPFSGHTRAGNSGSKENSGA